MANPETTRYHVTYRGAQEMPEETRRDLKKTNGAIKDILALGSRTEIDLVISASGILATAEGVCIVETNIHNVLLAGASHVFLYVHDL